MAAKGSRQGTQSQNLGYVAEETFRNLMQIWLDNTDANAPSRLEPDSQKVDFLVELPSLRRGIPSIQTFWQIKSSSQRLSRVKHPELGIDCFRLPLPTKTVNSLIEAARQRKHFYLAFAHNPSNLQPSELLQTTPQERFDWYCIDLTQQLKGGEQRNYILIPWQNKFNLSTFSLLWSSLWVEKFYSPFSGEVVIEIPDLGSIIKQIYPKKGEPITNPGNWDFLTKKLPMYEKYFDKDEFSKVSFPLGIGYALGVITKKLYDASSDLDTIQTYCPESLYGTANLWLFARAYHNFMCASGQVVKIDDYGRNVRILPLPDEPNNISGLVKACLWHIVLLYSSFDVEVRIVYRPLLEAGIDHSYYGGGIGYFPWLSLSDDGVTWMIEQSVEATSGQHRDFINEHMKHLYIDPYHDNILGVAHSFGLHPKDLKTASICPVQLFPITSRFIEYPYSLFGNAFRSIHSVRLQLSKGEKT